MRTDLNLEHLQRGEVLRLEQRIQDQGALRLGVPTQVTAKCPQRTVIGFVLFF